MNLHLTEAEQAFRDKLQAWLRSNFPERWNQPLRDDSAKKAHLEYLRAWQRRLYEGGWAGISWPREYGGGGATPIELALFQQDLAEAHAPERLGSIGEGLVGPTIIALGTEGQKARYLPRILSGEEIWCQGFSEPNAGSDLASLATRAVADGDAFVVNGQKVWTSYAQIANWCLLLARTDVAAPRHKGITCLLMDMHTPGIVVRPLRLMSGDAGFNEVFLTDVRIPATNVLGRVNEGWTVALTALANERVNLGMGMYVLFKRNLDLLIERARHTRQHGRAATENPLVRQKLAQAWLDLEVFRLNTLRAVTGASQGRGPGPEGSIQKLYWSEMNQRIAQTALDVLGFQAQQWECDAGRWAFNYLRSKGNTIEAGTSEIQRNIVAQRVLGLPRSY
ncbi:MAG: acyl-CoA dehydrogenase family protein [Planctomycetaceae bacterium]